MRFAACYFIWTVFWVWFWYWFGFWPWKGDWVGFSQHAMLTGFGFTKEQLATCARAAADLFLYGHAIAYDISV